MVSTTILRVALPLPLPREFDYLPPTNVTAHAGDIGRRVRVPFGNRELIGLVVEVGPAEPAATELRTALEFIDHGPLLHGELLESLRWLARYTHAPLGEVIATGLPAILRQGDPLPQTQIWGWRLTAEAVTSIATLRAGKPKQLAELLQGQVLSEMSLDQTFANWRNAARNLHKRGLVEKFAIQTSENIARTISGHALNAEQQSAVAAILGTPDHFQAWLLDGVTGSGKTEVYLHAIADCLARGRQALVLVPEIGLTPQTLSRFRARLGVAVHALHSGLSDGERARVWAAALRGEARVIVGTRSAIFLPMPEAGLIVVDEEHDSSFKQLDGIRYHARDFALYRAKALRIPVLLGSATPSLESLRNVELGRYRLLQLHARAGMAQPPSVRIIDIRKRPLHAGLSPELFTAIEQALAAEGQVLVFKNRRGYAPVLLCHDCGWSAQCHRCDAAMTVHAGGRRLQCHHCGARCAIPTACPDCGGLALQPQGAGTERIEEALQTRFPDTPILRIDRSSTQRRDAMEKLLAEFGDTPGILVGTQILAKGHDLPGLTLVVVVGIDEGLFSADFRAPEKLAQLLIQVSGRAGRATKPGEVLLQTHHPSHPLLQTLLSGGYRAFATQELQQRAAADFAPYVPMAMLRAEAKQAEHAEAFLQLTKHTLQNAVMVTGSKPSAINIKGPLPAPMPRRAGYQRTQLVLSANDRRTLHLALDHALPTIYALPEARKVRWSLDIDPIDLY